MPGATILLLTEGICLFISLKEIKLSLSLVNNHFVE